MLLGLKRFPRSLRWPAPASAALILRKLMRLPVFRLALADLDKAIALHRDYSSAYRDRGYVYALMGQKGKAEADFAKAKQLNPVIAIDLPFP